MADNTVIIFCSDHGDMLGERGLWFKMSFLDGSARTPLMIAVPETTPVTVREPVSNLDIVPTLADLAGLDLSGIAPWVDGQSLLPLMAGDRRDQPVLMEYAAEGSYAPLVAMVEGRFKFVRCQLDPDQMFDLENDPLELVNLADDPAYAKQADSFRAKIEQDGIWTNLTGLFVIHRRSVFWFMMLCATGPISPGTTNLCNRPQSGICVTIWT